MNTNTAQTNAGSVSDAALLHTRSELARGDRPEWLRIDDAVRIFGFGRTFLYGLIKSKAVKSFALRKKNSLRGIRLVSFDSLSAFCEEAAKAADEKEVA